MFKLATLVALALSTAGVSDNLRNRDVRLASSDLEVRLMTLANLAAHHRDGTKTERLADNARLEVWNFKQIAGIYDRTQLIAESRGVDGKLAAVGRAFGEERFASEKRLNDALNEVSGAWKALQTKLKTAEEELPLPPPHPHG